MIRTWIARPDVEMILLNGQTMMVVSRDAMAEALYDGLTLQERAGGSIEAIGKRIPTEFPGEMVTVLYVVTWKDRTDAKPQPEVAARPSEADPTPEELEKALEAADDAEERFLAEAEAGEDETSMEPAAR